MCKGTNDKDERFLIEHNVRRQWTNIVKVPKAKNVNLEFYIQWKPFKNKGRCIERYWYLYHHN